MPKFRFFTIFGQKLPLLLIERIQLVKKIVARFNINLLVKGPTDIIVGPNNDAHCINQTGNAGMTSGGTGDVLAGFIGRLIAGGLSPYDAGRIGVFIVCSAGDELALTKSHAFTATDLAHQIPYTLRTLLG